MLKLSGSDRSERGRTGWKIVSIGIGVLGLLALFGYRFYDTIQAPHWAALANAKQQATERLELREVRSVERFIGDQPYSVVFGTDANGEDVIVWIWADGSHAERQDAGLSREEVQSLAASENPAKRFLRLTPGKLGEEYVWEVYYSLDTPDGPRKFYDFYRFSDGTKLETYRLTPER